MVIVSVLVKFTYFVQILFKAVPSDQSSEITPRDGEILAAPYEDKKPDKKIA